MANLTAAQIAKLRDPGTGITVAEIDAKIAAIRAVIATRHQTGVESPGEAAGLVFRSTFEMEAEVRRLEGTRADIVRAAYAQCGSGAGVFRLPVIGW